MDDSKRPQLPPNIPDAADLFVRSTEAIVKTYERRSKREPLRDHPAAMGRVRTAVKRSRAGEYLFLLLASMAGSIGMTRLFLELADYPQIGNQELHIAHVLWGGLLVFIASLLPLALGNPWALSIAAILSGVGMGLFIDEVGKFITQSNNYFFPAAAPIIYVVFLLTAWLYLRLRRPASHDPRSVMYRVLEGLSVVLDRDLDPAERSTLAAQVRYVEMESQDSALSKLATKLKEFLEMEELELTEQGSTFLERWRVSRNAFLNRWVPRPVHKWLMGLSLGIVGYFSLRNTARLFLNAQNGNDFAGFIAELLDHGVVQVTSSADFFSAWISLESAIGVALILLAFFVVFSEGRRWVVLSQRTMAVYVALVNIFVFYFYQFSVLPYALFQFIVLGLLKNYRERDFRPT